MGEPASLEISQFFSLSLVAGRGYLVSKGCIAHPPAYALRLEKPCDPSGSRCIRRRTHFTSNAIEPPTGAPIPSPRPKMTGTRKSVTKRSVFGSYDRYRQRRFALVSQYGRQEGQVRAELFALKFAT